MSKYRIVYKTDSIFEMSNDSDFDFEESEIRLVVSDGVVELVEVGVEEADEQTAENKSNDIIMQLNNFWRYLYGSFLVPEPLKVEYIKKPNGMQTVTASLTLIRSVRGKVNVDELVLLYRKCGKDEKFRNLLGFFGDGGRSFKWDFLQLFKIIEFEKNAKQREEFIVKETGAERFERKSAPNNFQNTELTWKRHDMAHNLCPNISQNDLQTVNKLAKKILDKQSNQDQEIENMTSM
jgi:hypothetical protein